MFYVLCFEKKIHKDNWRISNFLYLPKKMVSQVLQTCSFRVFNCFICKNPIEFCLKIMKIRNY